MAGTSVWWRGMRHEQLRGLIVALSIIKLNISGHLIASSEQACIVQAIVNCHSKREKFWTAFHCKQINELLDIWSYLIRSIGG